MLQPIYLYCCTGYIVRYQLPIYHTTLNFTNLVNESFLLNQSIENACVAFAKGANESNEFFEIINKQKYMTNKSGQTRQSTNNLRDELIWGCTPSGDKGWCIIVPIERYNGYRYLQKKKRECCNH